MCRLVNYIIWFTTHIAFAVMITDVGADLWIPSCHHVIYGYYHVLCNPQPWQPHNDATVQGMSVLFPVSISCVNLNVAIGSGSYQTLSGNVFFCASHNWLILYLKSTPKPFLNLFTLNGIVYNDELYSIFIFFLNDIAYPSPKFKSRFVIPYW